MKRQLLCLLIILSASGICRAADPELLATQPTTQPTTRPAGSVEIIVDYSQTPELKEWVETKLQPTLEEWYPIIVADLPSNGFVPPKRFTVTIDSNYAGVAATGGTRVVVSPAWIKSQVARGPINEAVGSVVHEEVHVVQQYGYGSRRGGTPNPVWLVEGIADYIRWWKYEPASVRRPVGLINRRSQQPTSYKDSYQTTAAFLEQVAKNHDHEIVVKLNASLREGRYKADLWKQYTGMTVDELWDEFYETLKKK